MNTRVCNDTEAHSFIIGPIFGENDLVGRSRWNGKQLESREYYLMHLNGKSVSCKLGVNPIFCSALEDNLVIQSSTLAFFNRSSLRFLDARL